MVLLENVCYVRFLPLFGEPLPLENSKFCIIRVGQKPHRMLLNIGFLEGTNNQWRQEVGVAHFPPGIISFLSAASCCDIREITWEMPIVVSNWIDYCWSIRFLHNYNCRGSSKFTL